MIPFLNMKTRTIKQTVAIRATPHDVYRALMDSREHASFTNAAATISQQVDGAIGAYDGYITGKNLDLKEDKKIVQAWRADEAGWPKGHFSRLTIELKEKRVV